MTFDSRPPCHASGDLPSSSTTSRPLRQQLRVGLAERERVAGVRLVAAGDDHRRALDLLERVQILERPRARDRAQRVGDGVEVLVARDALAHERRDRLAPGLRQALDARTPRGTPRRRRGAARPRARRSARAATRPSNATGSYAGVMTTSPATRSGCVEREAQDRVRAHRRAREHRPLELELVEQRGEVGAQLVVAVGLGRRRGRRGAVAARVVADDAVPAALQRRSIP